MISSVLCPCNSHPSFIISYYLILSLSRLTSSFSFADEERIIMRRGRGKRLDISFEFTHFGFWVVGSVGVGATDSLFIGKGGLWMVYGDKMS